MRWWIAFSSTRKFTSNNVLINHVHYTRVHRDEPKRNNNEKFVVLSWNEKTIFIVLISMKWVCVCARYTCTNKWSHKYIVNLLNWNNCWCNKLKFEIYLSCVTIHKRFSHVILTVDKLTAVAHSEYNFTANFIRIVCVLVPWRSTDSIRSLKNSIQCIPVFVHIYLWHVVRLLRPIKFR